MKDELENEIKERDERLEEMSYATQFDPEDVKEEDEWPQRMTS